MDKIIGAVASALNLDATELSAELKDGEKWLEEEKVAEVLSAKVSAQVKAAKEAQYKRGIREKGKAVEQFLSRAGFANPDKLEGDALLEAAVDFMKASHDGEGGKDPKALTREELAKLPDVKALITEAQRAAGAKYEQLSAQFETEKKSWQSQRIQDLGAARLPEILEEAKVVLDIPGTEGSRAARIKAVNSMIDWGSVGVDDKGAFVFLDSDGQPKTDDFGKPVDFKKHVVSIASGIYGTHLADPKKGGAAPSGGPSGQGGGTYQRTFTFTDAKDFNSQYLGESDQAKRSTMLKDWNIQQKEQAAPQ